MCANEPHRGRAYEIVEHDYTTPPSASFKIVTVWLPEIWNL